MLDKIELSDEVLFWLTICGYIGGTLVLCAAMYKWFAAMIGKEVAAALIKAGVVAVL